MTDSPVDMPADMAFEVALEPLTGQLVRLIALAHGVQYQTLHCQRLPVLRILLQDLIRRLDPLLELLGLVQLDKGPKQSCILPRQGLVLGGHPCLSPGVPRPPQVSDPLPSIAAQAHSVLRV